MKRNLSLLLSIFMTISLGACSSPQESSDDVIEPEVFYRSVIWKNEDGTILQRDNYRLSTDEYEYLGATPLKQRTAQYHYDFIGWSEPEMDENENIIYTAIFEEKINTYTVTWVNYNDVVLETDVEVPYGTIPTYNGKEPTRMEDLTNVYTFFDWTPSISAVFRDITYKATFTNHTKFTITYHLNGGAATDTLKTTYTDLDDFVVPKLTKEGYTFLGWCRDEDLYEPVLDYHVYAGSTGNFDLYASFVGNQNELIVNSQDENKGTVEVTKGTGISGEDISVLATPSKGYYFENVLDKKGNVIATSGPIGESNTFEVEIIKPTNWNSLNVYVWNGGTSNIWPGEKIEPVDGVYKYTFNSNTWVSFILNNGSGGTNNQTSDSTIANYKDCYSIYVENSAIKGNKISKITDNEFSFVMPIHDFEITCVFTPITYNINYYLNGGFLPYSNPITYTIEDEPFTLKDPIKDGYTFLGWYLNDEKVEVFDTSLAESVSLEAHWTTTTYSITYECNEGTNSLLNPITYTIETETITLEDPTREGYEFKGWYLDEGFTDEKKVGTIDKGTYGNITLYAKWEAKHYDVTLYVTEICNKEVHTVSFETNGATQEVEDVYVDVNTTASAPEYLTKNNCVFRGWFIDEECTTLFDFDTPILEDITLYAGWCDIELPTSWTSWVINQPYYYASSGGAYAPANLRYTSGSQRYNYFFRAIKTETVGFNYKVIENSYRTGCSVHYSVVRASTGEALVDANSTNFSYKSVNINLVAGEVYYVSLYRTGTDWANFRFYFDSFTRPNNTLYSVDPGIVGVNEVIYDSEFTLDTYERSGFKFLGWFGEDGTQFTDEYGNSLFTWSIDDNLTLFAHWEEILS